MKVIEITTTQNVTIRYRLAPIWSRCLGGLIDAVIVTVAGTLLKLLVAAFVGYNSWVHYVTWMPLVGLYTLLFETFNGGATLGKKVMGNRVIRLDGGELKFMDYLMRWVFRAIDVVLTFASFGLLMMTTSERYQRLGDLLANTVVVSTGKNNRLGLSGLLRLENQQDYKAKYPAVLNLTEDEVLVLKDVVERARDYNNRAHQLAVEAAVKKVKHKLGLEPEQRNMAFLQTVIRDYVMLSR